MARGLWRKEADGNKREGKYLVLRRDGTVPEWPGFVLGAGDPAAPAALRAYARAAHDLGWAQMSADMFDLADEFDRWRADHGAGDPTAPAHRTDDPEIIAKMRGGHGA